MRLHCVDDTGKSMPLVPEICDRLWLQDPETLSGVPLNFLSFVLTLSRSAASRHLMILREAGVLMSGKGREQLYSLANRTFLLEAMESVID